MDICFPLFFFVRFISGILFLKEAIVGCYSIYKGCIFCEVLFGPRIVTCNKNLFEISTIIFSLKIEKRRILGEKFSQNPPLNGGGGGSGPLKPKKYLLIFTQKMGTKNPETVVVSGFSGAISILVAQYGHRNNNAFEQARHRCGGGTMHMSPYVVICLHMSPFVPI